MRLHLLLHALPLLMLALPAAASPVLHFQSAHDAAAKAADDRADPSVPKSKGRGGVPQGTPGFYDPATRTFQPLSTTARPGPAYTGTVTEHVYVTPGNGVTGDDTVFCEFEVDFGNAAGSPEQFFINHSERAAINFYVKTEPGDIPIPYSYVPNGSGAAYMRFDLQCHVNATDGTVREYSFESGILPIQTTDRNEYILF